MQTVKRTKIRKSGIDEFMDKPLSPAEYCAKWVPEMHNIKPNEYGYKGLCIKELHRITGYSEKTIKNWGSNFERAPQVASRLCTMANILNQTCLDWSYFADN
ncbi:hypothetical protein SPB21_03360 [Leptothoe sp. ISB3NOV94-8A]